MINAESQEFEDEQELDDEQEFEDERDYSYCWECTGYGDDYQYDPETDELICNCFDCPFNGSNRDWEE